MKTITFTQNQSVKPKRWLAPDGWIPARQLWLAALAAAALTSPLAGTAATPAQQAYLKASNTGAEDQFGFAVAVSGDTMVVGVPAEDSNAIGVNGNQSDNSAPESGAAYVFVRRGTNWIQQAYLKASNTGAGDFFGWSVAVSGDTVVVGAKWEDSSATGVDGDQNDNSATNSGAAYVFVRNGTNWSQQAYLKASNTGGSASQFSDGDAFGVSVFISGDTLVVGASGEDSNATGVNGDQSNNSAADSGAAYVFVRNGTTWTHQAYIKASNFGGLFGFAVALSGDAIVVGAISEGSSATGVNGDQHACCARRSGAAYVFVRNGATWSQEAYLRASNTGGADDQFGSGDQFGRSVGVSGDTAVVGAPHEDSNATGVNGNQGNNSAAESGAAYVFVRNGTNWSQQAYLKATNTGAIDQFGGALSVSGDTVVVGALADDSSARGVNGNQTDNSAPISGAAYVFVRSGTNWSQQAYLKASNTEREDQFGYSVAVSEGTVVVGAATEDSNASGVNGNQSNNSALDSGAAYVFTGFCSDPSGPPAIAVQPQDLAMLAGTTATFIVDACGIAPLSYRWRKEGVDIPGAMNSAYSITGIQSNHLGAYSVVVSNSFGSVTSRVARLELAILLTTVQPPLSQSVVAGGNVTFSVEIAGNPPPFDYEWRKTAAPLFTNRFQIDERRSFFTLTNVQLSHGGSYRVVIRNAASPSGVSPSQFTLTVLPDTDGDGLPDAWEATYPTAADPAMDTDNDGLTNLEEYRAGTDPTNTASVLRITRFTAGNPTTLEFDAVSNKTYTVQHTDRLPGGSWSKLLDVIARATNRIETATDSGAGTNRFYRVVTPRQP